MDNPEAQATLGTRHRSSTKTNNKHAYPVVLIGNMLTAAIILLHQVYDKLDHKSLSPTF
jgi:uncharacterized membrane protein